MKKYTLLSVMGSCIDPFGCFDRVESINNIDELTKYSNPILLLHGGADISPTIYNQKPNVYNQAEEYLSMRDAKEVEITSTAIKKGIPVIGICRGAQMLCALDGGTLIQHVDGHSGRDHFVFNTDDPELVFKSNSCHHQVMNPAKDHDNRVICYDNRKVTAIDEHNLSFETNYVPELVHFPQVQGLGVQGHPEWLTPQHPYVQYIKGLIKTLLFKE